MAMSENSQWLGKNLVLVKRTQESMERCNGCRSITERLLKTDNRATTATQCHPLPNTKILDNSKMKIFEDDKLTNATRNLKFVLEWVQNICSKRRKCWSPAFSPFFTNVFNGFLSKSLEVGNVWQRTSW